MHYTKEAEKDKEEILKELMQYHVNHLRSFDRLLKYLTENPRATLADIERDVYMSREIIKKARNNMEILYEFFGLKPQRPHSVTPTRKRPEYGPIDKTKIPPQILEPEDTDIQLPSDIEPITKAQSEYSQQEQNPSYSKELVEDNPVKKRRTRNPKKARNNLEAIVKPEILARETAIQRRKENTRKIESYEHVPKEIMDAVISIVAERMSASIENVTPNTKLGYDLGADPLDKAELYLDLEERFKIDFREQEDEEPFTTNRLEIIGNIAEYIMQKQKEPKINPEHVEENQSIDEENKPTNDKTPPYDNESQL